jgi:uncharacterized membrane protein
MSTGPVQLLVIGFDEPNFTGQIRAELDKLTASGAVKVIDAIAVEKTKSGDVNIMRESSISPDEMREDGAVIGGLLGLGMALGEGIDPAAGMAAGATVGSEAVTENGRLFSGARVPDLVEEMEPGTAAAVVLIEHMWAAPLRDAVAEAGGVALADTFIRPMDLVMAGYVGSQA